MGAVAAIRHRGDMGAITSLEDLDKAIRVVGLCDIALEQVEKDLDMAVQQAKDQAQRRSVEHMVERENMLALIQTYIEANRATVLKGRKSVKLNFGQVGFRSSPKLPLPKRGSDEMSALVDRLEMLKTAEPARFGNGSVITEKYVLKGGVDGLGDDALAELGLKRTRDDLFFVQPQREKIVDTEAGL